VLITLILQGGVLLDNNVTGGTIDPKCSQLIVFGGVNFETVGPSDGGTF
jgi:hypothetical protein